MNDRLRNENLKSLLWKLALPCILAQMVTLLYSIVDRMYIGALPDGMQAMAAIGLITPLISLITAVCSLFGRGGAPVAGIFLGEQRIQDAEAVLNMTVVFFSGLGILLTAGLYLGLEQVLIWLNAAGECEELTRIYLRIYASGTLFTLLGTGLNYYINTQGYTRYGMLVSISGAIANLLLDPLFIFQFHMGIAGAAWATVISQGLSFVIAVGFFFSSRTSLHIHLAHFKIETEILKKVLVLGSSPCFMSATEGLLMLTFNQQLLAYGGTPALSCMTILSSMFQLLLHPMEGVAQGAQPILSYNYGARDCQRVLDIIQMAISVNLAFSLGATALMEIWPSFFIGWFTRDASLVQLCIPMFRLYLLGCSIMGANSTFQQTYNSLGFGGCSFFFAFLRKIILLIPLLYLLPAMHLFPATPWMAVILAEPVSDFITTISNGIWFHFFIQRQLKDCLPSASSQYNVQTA